MQIKLQGGIHRGFPLRFNKGLLRPTSQLLKRRVFDRFQDMAGICFIDACAGVGSMGLEAFSRGAEVVFLIENNKDILLDLKYNTQKLSENHRKQKKDERVEIVSKDVLLGLKEIFSKINHQDLIINFDPPYENHKLYRDFLKQLKQELENFASRQKQQKSQTLIWIESCHTKGLSPEQLLEVCDGLQLEKIYSQGSKYIAIAHF